VVLEEGGWIAPLLREVFPSWVFTLDENNLLGAIPVLEFFLSRDGVIDVLKTLEVDEAVDLVSGRVGSGTVFAMLGHAQDDVVGHSDVESAGPIRQDVDVEDVFALRHVGRITDLGGGREADSSASLRNDKQECYGMTNKSATE